MPPKWICRECGWISETYLTAPNPFEKNDVIIGCISCKGVDSLVDVCDEEGCRQQATCGTPIEDGYRRTCGKHRPK
jgi:hypothetical protein